MKQYIVFLLLCFVSHQVYPQGQIIKNLWGLYAKPSSSSVLRPITTILKGELSSSTRYYSYGLSRSDLYRYGRGFKYNPNTNEIVFGNGSDFDKLNSVAEIQSKIMMQQASIPKIHNDNSATQMAKLLSAGRRISDGEIIRHIEDHSIHCNNSLRRSNQQLKLDTVCIYMFQETCWYLATISVNGKTYSKEIWLGKRDMLPQLYYKLNVNNISHLDLSKFKYVLRSKDDKLITRTVFGIVPKSGLTIYISNKSEKRDSFLLGRLRDTTFIKHSIPILLLEQLDKEEQCKLIMKSTGFEIINDGIEPIDNRVVFDAPSDFIAMFKKSTERECVPDNLCFSKEKVEFSVKCGDISLMASTSGELELSLKNGNQSATLSYDKENGFNLKSKKSVR